MGLLAVTALAAACRGRPARPRFALGLLHGLAWVVPALWWVTPFTGWGYLLLVLAQALFPALAALLMARRAIVATAPAAVVLVEYVRWHWPLGGLPLASPVLAQADGPFLGVASLGGPLAVLLAVGAAATVPLALSTRSGRSTRTQATVAALVAVVVVAAWWPPTGSAGADRFDVAVVQGGGPRGVPAVDGDLDAVFRRHAEATAEVPQDTDLVVWPEDVIDLPEPFAGSRQHRQVAALARQLDATFIVGVVEDVGTDRFRNAAVVVAPDGTVSDRYEKNHRVPFGEYVPARSLLDRVVDLRMVPRDAIAGDDVQVVVAGGRRTGVVVSFEGMFSRYARQAARAGGQLLVVPTNAASYTSDAVPAQQLAAARLRAVETGRAVVQAAPTGYSAIVDPDGTVRAATRLGAAETLRAEVAARPTLTPFTITGDWPVLAVAMLLLAAGWAASRRRQTEVDADPSSEDHQ